MGGRQRTRLHVARLWRQPHASSHANLAYRTRVPNRMVDSVLAGVPPGPSEELGKPKEGDKADVGDTTPLPALRKPADAGPVAGERLLAERKKSP